MKLLLTSAGLTNKEISSALIELVGMPVSEITLGYIPTAANVEKGDKGWFIDNLIQFTKQGFKAVDIIEITDLAKDQWLPRLRECNVICFGGGNEKHLAKALKESGLSQELPKLLEDRVYMGISAGSMVAGPLMSKEVNKLVYPDEIINGEIPETLQYVNFVYIPHFNSEFFPGVRKKVLQTLDLNNRLWSTDDQTALRIVDDELEVIGSGDTFTSE